MGINEDLLACFIIDLILVPKVDAYKECDRELEKGLLDEYKCYQKCPASATKEVIS